MSSLLSAIKRKKTPTQVVAIASRALDEHLAAPPGTRAAA